MVSLVIGVDFREHLTEAVSGCDYFVAVIGEQWLTISSNTGVRRLDDPMGSRPNEGVRNRCRN